MLPYRTPDNVIDGLVITFVDMTERKEMQESVLRARRFAESIVDTVRESLLVLDRQKRVLTANHSFYHTFQTTQEETDGKKLFDSNGYFGKI